MEGATVPLSQECWLLTQQTVASPEPIDSCASCAELRIELACIKDQLDDVRHRLAIAESLLNSLLRKESNARNEEDKGEGKTEEGHSLECLREPGNANTEEKKRKEEHSLECPTEPGNANIEGEKREEEHSFECPTEPKNAKTEEKRLKGNSLDYQTEPRNKNKEEEKRGEGHSTEVQQVHPLQQAFHLPRILHRQEPRRRPRWSGRCFTDRPLDGRLGSWRWRILRLCSVFICRSRFIIVRHRCLLPLSSHRGSLFHLWLGMSQTSTFGPQLTCLGRLRGAGSPVLGIQIHDHRLGAAGVPSSAPSMGASWPPSSIPASAAAGATSLAGISAMMLSLDSSMGAAFAGVAFLGAVSAGTSEA